VLFISTLSQQNVDGSLHTYYCFFPPVLWGRREGRGAEAFDNPGQVFFCGPGGGGLVEAFGKPRFRIPLPRSGGNLMEFLESDIGVRDMYSIRCKYGFPLVPQPPDAFDVPQAPLPQNAVHFLPY